MDRQTLRDWVHRYNDLGVDGLKSRHGPGPAPALTERQMAELKVLVIKGPDPATDKVVRWRCVDLREEVARRFKVTVHESTIGKWLHQLGLTRLQPRPFHPKKDAAALEAVSKHFPLHDAFGRRTGALAAVDAVSLSIARGEIYGLAGESGSGKSTIARMILGLTPPSGGRILLDGAGIDGVSGTRAFGRKVQMVFQNPGSSLNPRRTVGQSLAVPLAAHGLARGRRRARIDELLAMVRLPPAFAARFPHELSGGQKQRVAIARALAVEPELVVLDEPTSALDVSVQARVIGLLLDLGQRLGLTYLFISHDLGLMRNFAQRVGVLYRGRLVESGPAASVFAAPRHAYTRLLLASVPVISAEEEAMRPALPMIGGEVATADQFLAGLAADPPTHSPTHNEVPDT